MNSTARLLKALEIPYDSQHSFYGEHRKAQANLKLLNVGGTEVVRASIYKQFAAEDLDHILHHVDSQIILSESKSNKIVLETHLLNQGIDFQYLSEDQVKKATSLPIDTSKRKHLSYALQDANTSKTWTKEEKTLKERSEELVSNLTKHKHLNYLSLSQIRPEEAVQLSKIGNRAIITYQRERRKPLGLFGGLDKTDYEKAIGFIGTYGPNLVTDIHQHAAMTLRHQNNNQDLIALFTALQQ